MQSHTFCVQFLVIAESYGTTVPVHVPCKKKTSMIIALFGIVDKAHVRVLHALCGTDVVPVGPYIQYRT